MNPSIPEFLIYLVELNESDKISNSEIDFINLKKICNLLVNLIDHFNKPLNKITKVDFMEWVNGLYPKYLYSLYTRDKKIVKTIDIVNDDIDILYCDNEIAYFKPFWCQKDSIEKYVIKRILYSTNYEIMLFNFLCFIYKKVKFPIEPIIL